MGCVSLTAVMVLILFPISQCGYGVTRLPQHGADGESLVRGDNIMLASTPGKQQDQGEVRRIIRVIDLNKYDNLERASTQRRLKTLSTSKRVVSRDWESIKSLETILLGRGLWPICDWDRDIQHDVKFPAGQCTAQELKHLLELEMGSHGTDSSSSSPQYQIYFTNEWE